MFLQLNLSDGIINNDSVLGVYKIVARSGLSPQMVERWLKEYESDKKEAFPGVGQAKPSEKELYELRRQLKQTEEERDILKKALAIFSREHE
jgi:transposase